MKQIILDLTKDNQTIEITEDTEMIGLFVGHEKDTLKSTINVVHKKPNLKSNNIIKAVVYDKSRFDLTGNLVIETGARYTDAYLRIDALIMDNDASARAVPSLEITEDDVKGGHGATIGQVNKDQLFYLQSRGLTKQHAESTLAKGFIQALVDMVESDNIRATFLEKINN